jgi:hypothetical protein
MEVDDAEDVANRRRWQGVRAALAPLLEGRRSTKTIDQLVAEVEKEVAESSFHIYENGRIDGVRNVIFMSDLHADYRVFLSIITALGLVSWRDEEEDDDVDDKDDGGLSALGGLPTEEELEDPTTLNRMQWSWSEGPLLLVILGDVVDGKRIPRPREAEEGYTVPDPVGSWELLLHCAIVHLKTLATAHGSDVVVTIGNHDVHAVLDGAAPSNLPFYQAYVHETAKLLFGTRRARARVLRPFYAANPYIRLIINGHTACAHASVPLVVDSPPPTSKPETVIAGAGAGAGAYAGAGAGEYAGAGAGADAEGADAGASGASESDGIDTLDDLQRLVELSIAVSAWEDAAVFLSARLAQAAVWDRRDSQLWREEEEGEGDYGCAIADRQPYKLVVLGHCPTNAVYAGLETRGAVHTSGGSSSSDVGDIGRLVEIAGYERLRCAGLDGENACVITACDGSAAAGSKGLRKKTPKTPQTGPKLALVDTAISRAFGVRTHTVEVLRATERVSNPSRGTKGLELGTHAADSSVSSSSSSSYPWDLERIPLLLDLEGSAVKKGPHLHVLRTKTHRSPLFPSQESRESRESRESQEPPRPRDTSASRAAPGSALKGGRSGFGGESERQHRYDTRSKRSAANQQRSASRGGRTRTASSKNTSPRRKQSPRRKRR